MDETNFTEDIIEKNKEKQIKTKNYFILITIILSIVWIPVAFYIYSNTESNISVPLLSNLVKNDETPDDLKKYKETFQDVIIDTRNVVESIPSKDELLEISESIENTINEDSLENETTDEPSIEDIKNQNLGEPNNIRDTEDRNVLQ